MAGCTIIRRGLPGGRDTAVTGNCRAGIAGKGCGGGFRRIVAASSLVAAGTGPVIIQLGDSGNAVTQLRFRSKSTGNQRVGKDHLTLIVDVLGLIRDTHNIGRIIGIARMTTDTFRSQLVTSHGHGLAMTDVAVDRGADRGITMGLRRGGGG